MVPSNYFRFALALALVACAEATEVVNWVTTNGDAGFAGGSEATSSPITTDSDAETIVGSFPAVTLAIGESIELTGSVNITGNSGTIPGNQFRWGLFDAPGVPMTGAGSNYVGVWTAAPAGGLADIRSADGSTDNPFSSTATTVIVSAGDPEGDAPQFGTTFSFSQRITRLDETQITVSATLTDGVDLLVEWPETTTTATPASFTYDAVGILLGGSTNATQATFTDIAVSGAEPADIRITEIIVDADEETITLRWTSTTGKNYAVDSSTDLKSWPGDVNDGVAATPDSETTTYTFSTSRLDLGPRTYFRVRELAN